MKKSLKPVKPKKDTRELNFERCDVCGKLIENNYSICHSFYLDLDDKIPISNLHEGDFVDLVSEYASYSEYNKEKFLCKECSKNLGGYVTKEIKPEMIKLQKEFKDLYMRIKNTTKQLNKEYNEYIKELKKANKQNKKKQKEDKQIAIFNLIPVGDKKKKSVKKTKK